MGLCSTIACLRLFIAEKNVGCSACSDYGRPMGASAVVNQICGTNVDKEKDADGRSADGRPADGRPFSAEKVKLSCDAGIISRHSGRNHCFGLGQKLAFCRLQYVEISV